MRSIFLGTSKVYDIYNDESLKILNQHADLNVETVYTKEDLLKDPEKFKDTEFVFSTWGMPTLTEEEIALALPSLKAVFYGAGSVQPFARPFLNRGIKMFSAWCANAVPVAEYTLAQIILANKGFFLAQKRYNSLEGLNNSKKYFSTMPGNYGIKVGIIGAGMIGKMVINRLQALDVKTLVYDPFLSDEAAKSLNVEKASLEEIFSECQTISNHVANLPTTVGMLNYDLFKLMKENAVFINTGRGAQIVEDDLIRILTERPDISAVLDVTMPEPPEKDSMFYSLENVFLTPHIAGSAGLEVQRMGKYIADEFIRYSTGQPCLYEVTLKMLETMA